MDIDRTDIRILEQLQTNAKLSHAALGELVHLSSSQISRRVARLEASGLLQCYSVVLDPDVLGLDVEAFTAVSLDRHNPGVGDAFEQGIQAFDEILDCMAVTGEADYILRIVAPDLNAFASLVTDRLIKLPGVKMVRSSIGLRRIKRSHVMPLTYLTAPGEKRPKVRFHESNTVAG
jgi:DNA-binding Lrp family transcriptional regulator